MFALTVELMKSPARKSQGPGSSEIDLLAPAGGLKPELDSWRWARMQELPELIIPFKREVYEQVVGAFARFATP